jgi:Zn-finger nucleic acid-binding protein
MIAECPGCHSRYDVTGRAPGTKARCRCGTIFPLAAPSESARTLMCPECGAATPPDKHQCAFCGNVLAVVACPRCFGRVFLGAKHCEHCGTAIDRAATSIDRPAERRCPRCTDRPLIANLVGNVLLDSCAACEGLWIGRDSFEAVVKDRDRQASIVAGMPAMGGSQVTYPTGPAPIIAPTATYIRCPDCDTVMSRQNYAKRSGVIVDVCRAHGVWFDKDELRRVVEFVLGGGLDRVRQAELDALRETQRQKRATDIRLAAQAKMSETSVDTEWRRVWGVGWLVAAVVDLFT